ncbi:MAG: TSUP family transporter, partial [Candidatus Sulfotelmatobacter sp.]
VVGGGGLIQLPALLVLLPHAPVSSILGTNKMSSVFGTSAAAVTYTSRVKLEWPILAAASLTAFICSGRSC